MSAFVSFARARQSSRRRPASSRFPRSRRRLAHLSPREPPRCSVSTSCLRSPRVRPPPSLVSPVVVVARASRQSFVASFVASFIASFIDELSRVALPRRVAPTVIVGPKDGDGAVLVKAVVLEAELKAEPPPLYQASVADAHAQPMYA